GGNGGDGTGAGGLGGNGASADWIGNGGSGAPAGPADSVHMPVPAGMAGRCTAMTGPEGLAEPALAVPAATVVAAEQPG
ncbi:PE family protein, partial [Mycobacterium ulcerans]